MASSEINERASADAPPTHPQILSLVAELGDIRGEIAEQRAWAEGHDVRCDDRGAVIQRALIELKQGLESLMLQVRALQGRSDRAAGAEGVWAQVYGVGWRALWGILRIATGAGLALAGGHLVLGWK